MSGRIYSIDSMRIVAMVFVVIIHTDPFAGVSAAGNLVNFVLETAARFAVPFFFMASGYFLAVKFAQSDPGAYYLNRVATISSIYVFGLILTFPLFLAGTAVQARTEGYSVVGSLVTFVSEAIDPAELFYYGTSVSEILWFLPALIFAYTFIYGFVRIDKPAFILPIAIGFHLIGLLGASYTMFVDVPFRIRDGLFFGFFYTSLGYAVYYYDWNPTSKQRRRYLAATVLAVGFHFAERYALGYLLTGNTFADGVYSPSYTIGTALVTLSLFLFLLSWPTLSAETSLPSWGIYAVGVYVVHPSVLYVLEGAGEGLTLLGVTVGDSVIWHLFLTPAVFFGSLGLYLLAHKLHVIEIGGSHLPSLRRLRKLSP